MTVATKQKFEVYAKVSLPVSIQIEAETEQEAFEIAQYQLCDLFVQQVYLNLVRLDGEIVTPRVLDWDINVEDVFEA